MLIIQIRGTGGSGKSTVVRKVMERLGEKKPHYVTGRKQPLWYQFRNVAVLGQYETPCGGCDTIKSVSLVFELVDSLPKEIEYIICEGILLSEDVKHCSKYADRLKPVYLTTSLELCLERIAGRRLLDGNAEPVNPFRTTNRFKSVERSRLRLIALGVECKRTTSDQAVGIVLKLLGFTPTKGN